MRLALFLSLALALSCSDGKIKAPASDKNFDDSDDPGQMMMGSHPTDASTDGYVPDGEGKACSGPMDCAAPLRCIFPIAVGCGAKGTCALYSDPPMCASKTACGCDGKDIALCAPDGYAPAPIKGAGACAPVSDASSD